ncbi:MAG TPA: DUF308 domain-containing protein [Candidatus Dormibacteraeota bacterium]|jgi:uncharacterized membrane protein HdeD (DUF308 family)|nr:DUF308 domain-containing protein [Candidatus Dormibacteraeota bacterium]
MGTAGSTEMGAALARLGKAWGWIVAYGVLSLLAGLVAIVWPGATLVVIAIVFALQLLVGAVYQFVFVFAIPQESGWLRALVALVAILSLVVSVYLLGHVGLTLLVLAILLGAYWIAQGAIELFIALGHPEIRNRTWVVVSGLLSVVAGVIVAVFPGISLFTLTIVLGAWLVFFGAILIGRGWMLRSFTRTRTRTGS